MADATPIISIITPVYNPGDYFSACLASLETQTIFPQIEIVLVNDGSTDGSDELCDSFVAAHDNARVFHQSNRGQAAARNRAIEAADGEFLLLVDSDDAIAPEACETLLNAIEDSGADLVWGDYANMSLFKNAVVELASQGTVEMWRYMKCALSSGLFAISPCVQLVRTAFLKDNGITFPEGRIFEDQSWLLRLMLAGANVRRIDYPFYVYNVLDHPSSTTVVNAKRLMDAVDVIYSMIDDIEAASPPHEVREVAEAYVANSVYIIARTFISCVPRRLQELVRLRINDTYAYYAAQTQLLPKGSRVLGPAFINDPELFETELARIHETREAKSEPGRAETVSRSGNAGD